MDLSGIISISGKPGLYKVVSQAKNSIIVESLIDKKRGPAYATDRISALEDISIYTHSGDTPLKEIYTSIYEKENGKEAISHKESLNKLKEYLEEVLPEYDEDRVYNSDIKKLFQWYNLLLKSDNLKMEEKKEDANSKDGKSSVSKDPTPASSKSKSSSASKKTTDKVKKTPGTTTKPSSKKKQTTKKSASTKKK